MEETPFHLSEQDFRAEAGELLDAMAQEIDQADRSGSGVCLGAERINALFRAVHSFKGLCGLFGHEILTGLSHHLEDYLDRLRMGQVPLDLSSLDLLFDAHETIEHLVGGNEDVAGRRKELLRRLEAVSDVRGEDAGNAENGEIKGLDKGLRKSLTRYEEHRLRECQRTGKCLYLIRVELAMESFDSDLRVLTKNLTGKTEIISTMPSLGGGAPGERIGFQIIAAGVVSSHEILAAAGRPVEVESLTPCSHPQEVEDPSHGEPQGKTDAQPEPGAGVEASRDSTVRVDLNRLDQIMDSVGEIILSRRRITKVVQRLQSSPETRRVGEELNRYSLELNAGLSELQRYIVSARMVPVSRMVGRVSRLVRKLSRRFGKAVTLTAVGEATELDKVMIDGLAAPLMHLVRNAIDHGIESPEERLALGKEEHGRLLLAAVPRGNSVVISVKDDGRGIQVENIRRSAVKKGLIESGTELSLEKACEFIFQPGFSSSTEVNEISGRGYGMDVVRREISALKGSVKMNTVPGQGTTFEIELPITLAIIQCMQVRVGGSYFAIPINSIAESLRIGPGRLESIMRQSVLRLRGETVPFVDLRTFFQESDHEAAAFAVVARTLHHDLALGVDDLLGQREVVIKPIGKRLQALPGIAGAADLGEKQAALVLDLTSIAVEALSIQGAA